MDDDSGQVSYIVLQVPASDPDQVGFARGLSLVVDGSESDVEQVTIGLCPSTYDTCDDKTFE